jgi:hypothetical protein
MQTSLIVGIDNSVVNDIVVGQAVLEVPRPETHISCLQELASRIEVLTLFNYKVKCLI